MQSDPQFRLRDVDFDHPAMQVTMPLISSNSGVVRCIGTAFAVAPGLAITAEHVVHDWLQYEKSAYGYKPSDAVLSVTAPQLFDNQFCPWIVDATYCSPSADIAFLRFIRPGWWGDGPGQVQPRCARLNFNPPKVGDKLRVFGFPDSEMKDGILYISPSESTVRVRDVDIKTNITMRPLSYAEVDGQIDRGMSGGPCFDEDWNIVGVNCRGWTFEGDDPPISYVALLWPAMSVTIDLFKTGGFPALDLFSQGRLKALGYRRVHVASNGEVRLANVDPDSLVPIPYGLTGAHLQGSLEFAAANAKVALAEIQDLVSRVIDGTTPLNSNALSRPVRSFFWELDCVLVTSLGLAAARAGVSAEAPIVSWEELVRQWTDHGATAEARDELAALGFSWNGLDLSQIRAYSDLFRRGVILLISEVTPDGQTSSVWLTECFRGFPPVSISDGLERYYVAGRRFVRRLLSLADRNASSSHVDPQTAT